MVSNTDDDDDLDARIAKSVLLAADKLRGLPPDADIFDDFGTPQQIRYLRGALFCGSVVLVDQLFDDLEQFAQEGTVDACCWILPYLPQRFHSKFTVGIIRSLIVAAVNLTSQLTDAWTGPRCVAQELLFDALLDQVEVYGDMDAIDLPHDWRNLLETCLLEDTDYQFLFDPRWDGIEDPDEPTGTAAHLGMAPMNIENWFTPFNTGGALSPYVWDES